MFCDKIIPYSEKSEYRRRKKMKDKFFKALGFDFFQFFIGQNHLTSYSVVQPLILLGEFLDFLLLRFQYFKGRFIRSCTRLTIIYKGAIRATE